MDRPAVRGQARDAGQPLRISLITPSYNQGRFLEATIRSVVTQDYEGLEYVVVDGGSTDDSLDIITQNADHLASWVSEPDEGHADALNKGFARTSGSIMGWLNSSDLHLPWTLRTVAEVFRDVPEAQWIMGVPAQWSESGIGPRAVAPSWWNLYDLLAGNYRSIQQESVFWRRSLWDSAGGSLSRTLKYAADFDLWLRFMRLAPLYHLGTVLGGFRVHDERMGGQENPGYAEETDRTWRVFAAGFGPRTRMRAKFVDVLTLRGAQPLRQVLGRSSIPAWYTHPRITYDMESGKWVAR